MKKLLFALGLLVVSPSLAQTPTTLVPQTGLGGTSAVTVGASSAQILNAAVRYNILAFKNESATASIAVCVGTTTAGAVCTAALNTAGSFTIAPGQMLTLSAPNFVPGDVVAAIASGASTPLTVYSR